MTSLEESSTRIVQTYKPFEIEINDSITYTVLEDIEYTNALYKHLQENQILEGIHFPVIPHFDSQQSYFNFINYDEHKFNHLNGYIYILKKFLRENDIDDPNINYINLQLLTPLCRGCNCNSPDQRTCSICVSNYQTFLKKLKPNILKYIRNYPLLDIVNGYPDDNTSDYDLNTYIIEFNQEFNTSIPHIIL